MANTKGLTSSPTLQAKAGGFLQAAAEVVLKPDKIAESVLQGGGFHAALGVHFARRDEVLQAQHDLIKPVLRKLGGLRGNEATLRTITWRHAALWVRGPSPRDLAAAIQSLLRDMRDSGGEQVDLYLPNHTFKLAPGVAGISLGRVEIRPSEAAVAAAEPFAKTLKVRLDGATGAACDETGLVVSFPPACWRVRVDGAPANAREEGAWIIDVAISLARKLHRPWRGLAPDLMDYEPNAFEPTVEAEGGFLVQGGHYGSGAFRKARYYLIDEAAAEALMSPSCQAIADLIFDPPPLSLAERVAQGLGWLTRARRARDKSEAFLHFFTALEAVFADKGQPVTATMSRHVAVIRSDDPEARREAARWLTELYDVRSALVHAGRRGAIAPDVRGLHHAADHIFMTLLHDVDLAMPAEVFTDSLRDASYGGAWPYRGTD